MFRSHGTTPTVGKFGLLAVKKIWTLESRSRCKCVHSDRLNFCTAKAWLYGCVVTQLQGEENCKQKLRMWIYEWYACYYSLCLEILRFEQFRVSSAKTLNGSVWLECLVKFFDKYCVKEALAYFFFNWATWNSRKISLKEWEVKSIPQRRVYWRRGCCRIVRSTIGNFKKRRRWRQRKRHYFKVFAVFFFQSLLQLLQLTFIVKCWYISLELKSWRRNTSQERERKVQSQCCVYVCFRPTKRLDWDFHVIVMQWKGCCTWILHVQSCCFAY